MLKRLRRGPSGWVPTAISMCALFIALGGTAYAVKTINGKTIKNRSIPAAKIKKNVLGPNEINEKRLASKLPLVPLAAKADKATLADRATSADGYFSSPLIKLAGGQEQVITTRGPFEFKARCVDSGGGTYSSDVLVKNVGSVPAIEQDDEDGNYSPPTTLAPGDSTDVFYTTSSSTPYWFGDYYNMFAVASEDGTALNGLGSLGNNVLGANCVFQLSLFG